MGKENLTSGGKGTGKNEYQKIRQRARDYRRVRAEILFKVERGSRGKRALWVHIPRDPYLRA